MFGSRKIAVVVPAYREEQHVGDVIDSMPDLVDLVVVVDDASPDETFAVASAHADARTEVIRHEKNTGVGGAILTGHRRAMERGADVMVVMAGDAQMDPEHLPALLGPVVEGGYGFSKANRFYSAQSFAGMPKHRVVGNIVLTFLTKVSSGYWDLVDPQNGYTAVTRESLERVPLDKVSQRYEFENDLLIWLNIAGVRACDVPVPAVYGSEVSGIKLHRVVPRILGTLWRGFWRRLWLKYVLWSFSPIALLFVLGSLALLVGLVCGVWALALSAGGSYVSPATWLLAVGASIVGVQFLLNALVLDIQATPR